MMPFFVAILVADLFTLAITIAAAIRKPALRYKLIGVLALCATLFALRQVLIGEGNPFALLFITLFIVVVAWPRSL